MVCAHRSVLSTSSDMLNVLLNGGFKSIKVITGLKEFTAEQINLFLDLIYGTTTTKELTIHQLLPLFVITDHYCLPDLNYKCKIAIKQLISDPQIYLSAWKDSDPVLLSNIKLAELLSEHNCVNYFEGNNINLDLFNYFKDRVTLSTIDSFAMANLSIRIYHSI